MISFIFLLLVTWVVATPMMTNNNNTLNQRIIITPEDCAAEISTNTGIQGITCTYPANNHYVKIRTDYKDTPGIGIHKFHPSPLTFNEARKVCIEEGGHLAIINSAAEEQVLRTMFVNSVTSRYSTATHYDVAFVGIHCLFSRNDWVTVLGDSIHKAGYDQWADGQPNNFYGGQSCGSLQNTGKLNDVGCDSRLPFFCELYINEEIIFKELYVIK